MWLKKETNVQFWFGDLWPLVKNQEWSVIFQFLQDCQFSRRIQKNYLTIDDCTIDHVRKKYKDYGEYRFRHASEVIQEIRTYLGQDLDTFRQVMYPITMVDCIGREEYGLIAYNRQTYNRHIVLWPLQYHLDECRKGFDDVLSFQCKTFQVVFRGTCSSPLYSKQIDVKPPIMKTSRYEIIQLNHEYPWADLGLTKIELYENHPDYEKELPNLQKLNKGDLSREKQMHSKFILCIEGADISTSFGWALASHCVAIHPYPFLYEVWYFEGLKPWVHFIPIALDGSDLSLVIEWCRHHLSECETMAETSRRYMNRMCDPCTLTKIKRKVSFMWKLPVLF